MNTVRINGQDYTSSLSDTEIAFIGNLSLPTTAQTLSGAIAEHENDISELNSNKVDIGNYAETSITSLDDIGGNSMGRVQLAAAISPSGGNLTCNYICFGAGSNKAILVTRANNNTYICNCASGTWGSWTQLN